MMCPISKLLLLLLASACVFSRHVDIVDKNNFGVFGGNPINITEVPFMALYRPANKTWWCSAVIVDEQFLLTAGHCVYKKCTSVTVGTDKAKSGGNDFKIEKVFRHPKYHITRYDIAVIKLKQKLVFNEKINKIKMADSSMMLHDGDMMQTIGFGVTEKHAPSNQLLSVELPYVNRKTCKKNYEQIEPVREEMICAGGQKGKGLCHGDAGSPIFYKGYLYGVASWSLPCAVKGYPAVFTSVPSTKDFIEDVIKKNS